MLHDAHLAARIPREFLIDSEQNKFLKYKKVACLKNEMIKSAKIKQDNLIICELREERKQ